MKYESTTHNHSAAWVRVELSGYFIALAPLSLAVALPPYTGWGTFLPFRSSTCCCYCCVVFSHARTDNVVWHCFTFVYPLFVVYFTPLACVSRRRPATGQARHGHAARLWLCSSGSGSLPTPLRAPPRVRAARRPLSLGTDRFYQHNISVLYSTLLPPAHHFTIA
jgi:hypothetical protein